MALKRPCVGGASLGKVCKPGFRGQESVSGQLVPPFIPKETQMSGLSPSTRIGAWDPQLEPLVEAGTQGEPFSDLFWSVGLMCCDLR